MYLLSQKYYIKGYNVESKLKKNLIYNISRTGNQKRPNVVTRAYVIHYLRARERKTGRRGNVCRLID